MDIHEQGWPRRLRERPPPWPRRNDDDGAGLRRWERDREPFEDGALPELYPGALVMEDLAVTDDEFATLRILARYTVARLLTVTLQGLDGAALRTERRVALQHTALLPEHDWERRTLERLAGLCREPVSREIVQAATGAAEAAAKRGQVMGAFALYRAGYEAAVGAAWWAEAAGVARGISQLARLDEARYSVRLWRRRAAVLERRAVREEEASSSPPPSGADGGT